MGSRLLTETICAIQPDAGRKSDLCQWKSDTSLNKMNYKDPRQKSQENVCYDIDSKNGMFPTFRQARKRQFSGRVWDKLGFKKTQADVSSKRRDLESSTDMNRQNKRLRHDF